MAKHKKNDKTVTFVARGANLRLVRKPAHRIVQNGEAVDVKGESVDFAPGGLFTTEDEDTIAWLREHPKRDVLFFERGDEPGALKPSVDALMPEIIQASVALDSGRLKEIREAEEATHRREVVFSALDAAEEQVAAATGDAKAA